jgi:peptide/nickel transport system permease protein/dipeptide transport system permease protein
MPIAVAQRCATLAGILLVMTFLIFILEALVPGDPARLALGPSAPMSELLAKRHELGLDQPLLLRYAHYLAALSHLDFGTSIRTHRTVLEDLSLFLPASLELATAALGLGIPIGLAYGAATVLGSGTRALQLALIALSSSPIFFTGLLLSDLFWFHLHLLPSGGRLSLDQETGTGSGFVWSAALLTGNMPRLADATAHLVLPAITLMLPMAIGVGRTFAASLQAVQTQIHIRTARAKGLSETQIFLHHMVRNAAVPVLSMVALQIAILLANMVVVERIFAWPGLGSYAALAIGAADVPAIQGASLAFAVIYIAASAVIDSLQVACDPRSGPGKR